jgi:hypothetical protein
MGIFRARVPEMLVFETYNMPGPHLEMYSLAPIKGMGRCRRGG